MGKGGAQLPRTMTPLIAGQKGALQGATTLNGTMGQTSDSLALQHRNNSSSVSSNIAEFIPMRSIIKSTDSVEGRDEQSRGWNQGKKKVVRFDDMVLIGEDNNQIQLFLSDEEASIVEKKGTPTKLNMQSSAELRRRIRQEKQNARMENGHRAQAGGNKVTPKRQTPELSIDQVLDQKRKRT